MSKNNWKVYKDDIDFEYGLNLAKCKKCGEMINWKSEFDADGNIAYAKCDCGLEYIMKAITVQIEAKENN